MKLALSWTFMLCFRLNYTNLELQLNTCKIIMAIIVFCGKYRHIQMLVASQFVGNKVWLLQRPHRSQINVVNYNHWAKFEIKILFSNTCKYLYNINLLFELHSTNILGNVVSCLWLIYQYSMASLHWHNGYCRTVHGPLLLTWFNFNPSMDN